MMAAGTTVPVLARWRRPSGDAGKGVENLAAAEEALQVPALQMKREIVEVMQLVLVERIRGQVADQMVDVPVPLVMEEIMTVVQEEEKLVPQERVQQRTAENIEDIPQFREETVEMVGLVPQERVQWIDEPLAEVFFPAKKSSCLGHMS